MSIYRYAGVTLALNGFITRQENSYPWCRPCTSCPMCRARVTHNLRLYVEKTRLRPSDPYWMAA